MWFYTDSLPDDKIRELIFSALSDIPGEGVRYDDFHQRIFNGVFTKYLTDDMYCEEEFAEIQYRITYILGKLNGQLHTPTPGSTYRIYVNEKVGWIREGN